MTNDIFIINLPPLPSPPLPLSSSFFSVAEFNRPFLSPYISVNLSVGMQYVCLDVCLTVSLFVCLLLIRSILLHSTIHSSPVFLSLLIPIPVIRNLYRPLHACAIKVLSLRPYIESLCSFALLSLRPFLSLSSSLSLCVSVYLSLSLSVSVCPALSLSLYLPFANYNSATVCTMTVHASPEAG